MEIIVLIVVVILIIMLGFTENFKCDNRLNLMKTSPITQANLVDLAYAQSL
jgi:hypothetical protein